MKKKPSEKKKEMTEINKTWQRNKLKEVEYKMMEVSQSVE